MGDQLDDQAGCVDAEAGPQHQTRLAIGTPLVHREARDVYLGDEIAGDRPMQERP